MFQSVSQQRKLDIVRVEPKAKLSYDDYANTPEGERYELIDGELIRLQSNSTIQQHVSMHLLRQLLKVEEMGLGWVYLMPFDVVLSDHDVVQPNLMFISRERRHIITAANVQGAPDLVVEILSPSIRKRHWTPKWELYERHGVKEMWLIDAEAGILWLMLPRDGRLEVTGQYREGQTFKSPTLGGLSIDLTDAFSVSWRGANIDGQDGKDWG